MNLHSLAERMENTPEETDKIQCRECGKSFDFLAPHVSKVHQISLSKYRERWGIPRQQPLASVSHRSNCRANVIERIKRGDLCPDEQVEMMRQAYSTFSFHWSSNPDQECGDLILTTAKSLIYSTKPFRRRTPPKNNVAFCSFAPIGPICNSAQYVPFPKRSPIWSGSSGFR